MYTIYALIDPRDNTIRYVGFTKNLQARLSQHLWKGSNPNKDEWVQDVLSHNLTLNSRILGTMENKEDAARMEIYWIQHFLKLGAPLTNMHIASGLDRDELPNGKVTYKNQYRKCNRTSCSTCREGHGHGPYWYAFKRIGSKVKSYYLGKMPDGIPG